MLSHEDSYIQVPWARAFNNTVSWSNPERRRSISSLLGAGERALLTEVGRNGVVAGVALVELGLAADLDDRAWLALDG
jgi:hypothetical protein